MCENNYETDVGIVVCAFSHVRKRGLVMSRPIYPLISKRWFGGGLYHHDPKAKKEITYEWRACNSTQTGKPFPKEGGMTGKEDVLLDWMLIAWRRPVWYEEMKTYRTAIVVDAK